MKKIIVFGLFLLTCQFAFSQQWEQLGADIDGEAAGDESGVSISLSSSGNRVAIGAYLNNGNNGGDSGHVRVFEFNGMDWVQLGQDIDGEAPGDESGYTSLSLSDDGNRVAIGARNNDGSNGNNSGHVRVFEFDGVNWDQLGQDIDGEAAGDRFGASLSLSEDGNRVAIGAVYNEGSGGGSGHARVYELQGGNWVQLGSDINGEAPGDLFGRRINLNSDGTILAVGAPLNNGSGSNSGHVRVYQWNGVNWSQLGQDIDGEAAGDYFANPILNNDGNRIAIGGRVNDGNGIDSGHVRIYQWNGASWNQLGQDIDGEAAGDRSGIAVSFNDNGNTVAIGAYWNDGNGTIDAGHVRVFEFIPPPPPPDPDTALGEGSGANSTGEGNVFVGYQSGMNTTDGNFNTFVGSESGFSNQNGSGNVFLGHQAGYNESGSNLLYIDNSDTDSPLIRGDFENDLLRFNGSISIDSIPQDDSLVRVLVADNDGYVNWRDAASIGSPNDFPSYPESAGDGGEITNIYFGYEAGLNSTGNGNSFTGYQSGYNNIGNENTAAGNQALFNNTYGEGNVALGHHALFNNTEGFYNIAIGYNAGPALAYPDLYNTIAIGWGATVTGENAIAIGQGASADENEVRIGNYEVDGAGAPVNWTVVSDGRFKINIEEDVAGLDFINALRPVSYNIDRRKIRAFTGNTNATNSDVSEKIVGFIAQEVAQAVEENDYVFTGVRIPKNEKDHYGLKYAEFVVPLVKGMQELGAENKLQKALIETLQQEIETLKNAIYGTGSASSPTSTTGLKAENTVPEGFILEQNIPNPFNQKTSIKAVIPEGVQQAKIVVYNLQGLELESYDINQRGNVAVEISGGRFPSGMYIYALLADGRVIDTKKMILTK